MEQLVPSIPITLDKQRTLRFDINAMIAARKQTGRPFFSVLRDIISAKDGIGALASAGDSIDLSSVLDVLAKLPIEDIRDCVWAGLLHEDPSLTVDFVGRCIGASNLLEIVGVLASAIIMQGPESSQSSGDATENPQVPSPTVS